MSLLHTHSSNPDQPANENEVPVAEQPVDEQPTTAAPTAGVTDDPTVAPAGYDDYDENYDERSATATTDDEIVPAADYGRGDYADETPATDQVTDETAVPATSAPAASFTPAATDVPTTDASTTVAPVPTQRTTGEGRTVSQAVPATATTLDGPLLGDVDAAELRNRWQQVQGEFVDDPKAAVGGAADLVEQTAQAMVEALQQRQRQMRGLWQQDQADGTVGAPSAADTEQLRMMMQQYRTLFTALCEQ